MKKVKVLKPMIGFGKNLSPGAELTVDETKQDYIVLKAYGAIADVVDAPAGGKKAPAGGKK